MRENKNGFLQTLKRKRKQQVANNKTYQELIENNLKMYEPDLNAIGERIKELRIKKEISQKELAEIIDVDCKSVSNWEIGKRGARAQYIIKMARYFEVSCDYILCGVKSDNIDINRKLGLSNEAIGALVRANNPDLYYFTDKEATLESALSKGALNCINTLLEETANLNALRVIDYIQSYLDFDTERKRYNLVDDESNEKETTLKTADILAIKLYQIQEALVALKKKIEKEKSSKLRYSTTPLLNTDTQDE